MKTGTLAIVASVVLTLSTATVVSAANKFWKNSVGSGAWSVGSNWSNVSAAGADNGGAPAAGDTPHLIPTDGAARTITYDVTAPPQFITYIDLTGPGTNRTTFDMSGNTLTTQALAVGYTGRATFNHSAGAVILNNPGLDMAVGEHAGGDGIYNLSGTGALSVAHDLFVGRFASSTGTFNQSGGTNSVTSQLVVGADASSSGVYNLSGGTLSVGNSFVVGSNGTGTLTVQPGGSASTNNLSINSASTVNLNGGTLRFNTVGGSGGVSRINYTAGTIQLTSNRTWGTDATIAALFGPTIPAGKTLVVEGDPPTDPFYDLVIKSNVRVDGGSLISQKDAGIGISSPFTAPSVLTINDGLVHIQRFLRLGVTADTPIPGILNLNGGTLRFDQYIRIPGGGGEFNFNAGTLQLAGNRTIGTDEAILDILGGAPTLTVGKGLAVEGTATIHSSLTLAGGAFTAPQIVNANKLNLLQGTFNLTNQPATVGNAGLLGSSLELPAGMTLNVSLGLTNSGLITGDGQVGGTFTNDAAGELRAEPGRSLTLTGANNTNAGQINLYGGMLDFTQNLANNAGAFISGNGTLKTAGLTNNGTMNFSGLANVVGDVTNSPAAKIISSGGGPTTFFDDVANQGEIRTTAGSFTVFYGATTGAGSYTGAGTVNFEGDLKPGNSAAAISFGGDVVFGAESALDIELGGIAAGSGYDQLNVAGKLTLGGELDLSLINGFTPAIGQAFDILNWSTLSGTFSSVVLPALPAGRIWDASQLYTTGVLAVAPQFTADFDEDGDVDSSDLARWRTGFGTGGTHTQGDANGDADVDGGDFLAWQQQFGLGPGAVPASTAVPEPATAVLAIAVLQAIVVASRRQR
jgi:hypothetical protein